MLLLKLLNVWPLGAHSVGSEIPLTNTHFFLELFITFWQHKMPQAHSVCTLAQQNLILNPACYSKFSTIYLHIQS